MLMLFSRLQEKQVKEKKCDYLRTLINLQDQTKDNQAEVLKTQPRRNYCLFTKIENLLLYYFVKKHQRL